jgi:hypothetical protein
VKWLKVKVLSSSPSTAKKKKKNLFLHTVAKKVQVLEPLHPVFLCDNRTVKPKRVLGIGFHFTQDTSGLPLLSRRGTTSLATEPSLRLPRQAFPIIPSPRQLEETTDFGKTIISTDWVFAINTGAMMRGHLGRCRF